MPDAEQILILCDEHGTATGYAPRSACHRGAGQRHQAIMVFLRDPAGRLSIARRRHALWDDLWDLGGATHPLHDANGDESRERAARRCLRDEWNIDLPVEHLFDFNYRAEDGSGGVEFEHCAVYVADCVSQPAANPDHAYEVRWLETQTCRDEVRGHPEQFTPWARDAIDRLP